MLPPEEPILRRDFPASADGYDRAAVDAHLEAIAAGWPGDRRADIPPAEQVVAAGRLLLGQISALRVELKNLSASLREQGVTISDALEELLDLEDAPPTPPAAQSPPAAPSPPATRPSATPVSESPPPAAPSPAGPAAVRPAAPPLPGPPPAAGTAVRTAPPTEPTPDTPPPAAAPPPAVPDAALAGPPAVPDAAAAPDPRTLEDARLVALDMALGGSSRAEIDRELARFDLPDRAGLLDAVLSAIG